MPSPPSRTTLRRLGLLALFVVALAGVGVTAGASVAAPESGPDDDVCEYDSPGPGRGAEAVEVTYENGLPDDSLADWTGGRIARVGAAGDCSLAVLDGETATLTAATVDGTRGIVTGTLDLGANGSLRLVPTERAATATATTAVAPGTPGVAPEAVHTDAGTPGTAVGTVHTDAGTPGTAVGTVRTDAGTPGTAVGATATDGGTVAGATAVPGTPTVGTAPVAPAGSVGGVGVESGLVVANDGSDFAAAAVLSRGNRSERLALSSGRFFAFRARWTDRGAVRVAVWEAGEPWDGEWDVRFDDGPTRGAWRVQLRGRAFLDDIAVGVPAAPEQSTTAPGDGTDPPDDDPEVPGPDPGPGFDPEPDPGREDRGGGNAFVGLLLVGGGAVGYRYAYGLTRFSEQLDAIGSTTRAGEVEPAGWNVALTKLLSAVIALVGLAMVAGALL